MARLHLVEDAAEIARRRPLCAKGRLVETWPDLYVPGRFWLGDSSKALLDAVGEPLPSLLSLPGDLVPVFYGPQLTDLESLPSEESLRSRVLSAHGLAAACITIDGLGERTQYEPQSPRDPIFFLRRPGGAAAHIWRLFRAKREAEVYMAEYFGRDPEAAAWAQALPAATWEELVEHRASGG